MKTPASSPAARYPQRVNSLQYAIKNANLLYSNLTPKITYGIIFIGKYTKPDHRSRTMITLTNNTQIRTTADTYQPEIRVGTENGYTPWTMKVAAVVSSDYTGKTADMKATAAAYAAAPVILDGQQVEIDGKVYTAKYARKPMQVSDPIEWIAA